MNQELRDQIELIMKDYFTDPPGWWMYAREGKISREAGITWLKHFHHFASSFPRWLANVAGACPHSEVRRHLIRNMWDEEVSDSRAGECHVDLLLRMAEGLGVRRGEVQATPELPTTTVALRTWDNLTRSRTWLEGLATLQFLERTNDEDLAKKYGLLPQLNVNPWESLGLSHEALAFIWVHIEADKVHSRGEAYYLEKFAVTDEELKAVVQATRESMTAWKIFNNGIYDAIPAEAR
jgi:pyrroloquinoline quinone (PQQ) biosynthesis protein C